MLKTLERLRAARKNESGFTLIELLIVIVILGVLAGVVVFAVGAFNNDGKTAACKADYKNIEIASEAYLAKKNGHASDIDDADHTATTLVGAGFIKEAPGDDGYLIHYDDGTGAVWATGACTMGTPVP